MKQYTLNNSISLLRKAVLCLCCAAIWTSCQDTTDDTAFKVPNPDLGFTEPQLNLSPEQQEYAVGIESNLPWRVKTAANWIDLKTPNGPGTGSFTISVAGNPELTEREAEITAWITDEYQKSIKVFQRGKGILLKQQTLTIGTEAKVLAVPFSTLVEYTCEAPDSWIHITNKPAVVPGIVNELSLSVKVDAYTGEGSRTGFVKLKGANDVIETLTIIQDKEAAVDSDRACLRSFFENANGFRWTKKWNLDAPLENSSEHWPGVIFENERVTGIDFQTPNNIEGDITPLCGLSELSVIKLKHQKIAGIPTEIGQLSKLSVLWVIECAATGALPEALGECKQLTALNISNHPTNTPAGFGNMFSGNMDMLINIPAMTSIKAYCNNLSGGLPVIPLDAGNQPTTWDRLKEILVYSNSISGSIPYGYGILIERSGSSGIFRVNDNQLNGQIPSDLKAWSQYAQRKATWILQGNNLTE